MKNHYELLEISPKAGIEAISTMYELKVKQVGAVVSEDQKVQLWALRDAYETLRNPVKRRSYDQKISTPSPDFVSRSSPPLRRPPELTWKSSVVLISFLVMGVVGYGLHLKRSTDKDVQSNSSLKINKDSEVSTGIVANQKTLVQGVVKIEEKRVDAASSYLNQVEARQRQELEYRANAGQQILDMERQRMNQIAMLEKQRAEDIRRRMEEDKAAKERAYWSCMNAALDRAKNADANLYCSKYRY